MKKRILKVIIPIIIFGIFVVGYITKEITFAKPVYNEFIIGIIDSEISEKYAQKVFSMNTNKITDVQSHGNEMLEFIFRLSPNAKIYYYDASVGGIISENSLVDGITWMEKNGVKVINISLSSSKYSKKLEDKIKNFVEEGGVIVSSYNNRKSSFDYPAQYNEVIGVGTEDIVKQKEKDSVYKTSKILLKNKIYTGNSYLSVYEAVKVAKGGENEK